MNRRTFLGLVGGTIAAAATPAEFFALTEAAPAVGRRLVTDLFITANESGLYTVSRANMPDWRAGILHLGIGRGSSMRWVACPGDEIVLMPGEPQLVIDGPGMLQWAINYTDDEGHRYSANSQAEITPLDVRIGARARRRRALTLVK